MTREPWCYVKVRTAGVDWPRYDPHRSRLNFHKSLFHDGLQVLLPIAMLPTTTQQFKIYPALTWRQYLYSVCIMQPWKHILHIFFLSSAIIHPCHPSDWYTSIDRPPLCSSILLCCCLEFRARAMQAMAAKDFRLEREGAFPAENMGYYMYL